jgi:RNA recognition motif-containing protein
MTNFPVKIFISGYPLNSDEIALVQLVSRFGQVSTIKIVRDKQSKKPKGYAFIEMVSRDAAEEVRNALDGLAMNDKTLTVNIVEETPPLHASLPKNSKYRPEVKIKPPRLPR